MTEIDPPDPDGSSSPEDFTVIDGVGPKTAEDLADIGYDTPRALAQAYLTTDTERIHDRLHDVPAFHRWLRGLQFRNADLGVEDHRATDVVGMMILARMRDAAPEWLADGVRDRDHTRVENADSRHKDTRVDGLTVRPTDVDWGGPCVVTPDETLGYGPSVPGQPYAEAQYEPAEEIEAVDDLDTTADEYWEVRSANHSVTLIQRNVEAASVVAGVNPVDDPTQIELGEDDGPVRIQHDGVNRATIAPYIPRTR